MVVLINHEENAMQNNYVQRFNSVRNTSKKSHLEAFCSKAESKKCLLVVGALSHSRPAFSSNLLAGIDYTSLQFWVGAVLAILIGVSISKYRQVNRIEEQTQDRARRISEIEKLQQDMREAGSAAERRVGELALQIAGEFDPDATMRTGLVINYPNARPDQMPKFEVDCLLISRLGVVMIEVKNWAGAIKILPNEWVIDKQGILTRHRSPIDQGAPKKRAIEQILDARANGLPVQSIIVLSHQNMAVPVDAPLAVMSPSDLRFYLRTLYHASLQRTRLTPAQIDVMRYQIACAVDQAEDAKHRFLLQLAERKIGAFEYLDLHKKLQKIQEEPLPCLRPAWRCASPYILLIVYMFVMHLSFSLEPPVRQNVSAGHLVKRSNATRKASTHDSKGKVPAKKTVKAARTE